MASRFAPPVKREGLSSFDRALQLGQFGVQLFGLQQQFEGARADRALTNKELGIREEQVAVQRGQLGVNQAAESRLGVQQRTDLAATGTTLSGVEEYERLLAQVTKPIDLGQFMLQQVKTKAANEVYGAKIFESLAGMRQTHRDLVKAGAGTQTLYKNTVQNYDFYTKGLKELLSKELEKNIGNPAWQTVDPRTGKTKEQLYTDTISSVETKKFAFAMFPVAGVVTMKEMDAAFRQGVLKNKGKLPPKFGETFTGPGGALLQTEETTGQTRQIVPRPSKGQKFTVGPDGTVTFEQGGTAGAELDKPTSAGLQKDLIQGEEQAARLDNILRKFRPEFTQLNVKWDTLMTSLRERAKDAKIPFTDIRIDSLINLDVSEEDRQLLADYTDFRRDAIENLNLTIKAITGAQMSEKEVVRLKQQVPNPGLGLFDGDSFTEFQTKLESSIEIIKKSQSRRAMWLNQGFNDAQIASLIATGRNIQLDDMPKIVSEREAGLRLEGKPEEEIEQILKQEFGL